MYVEEAIDLFYAGKTRISSVSDVPIYVSNNYYLLCLIDTSKYVSPTFYLEAVAEAASSGNNTYVSLYDLGTSDDAGTTGTQVTGSELTFSSTGQSRSRSNAITLTSGNRYIAKVRQTTSVTTSVITAVRIIVVDNIGSSWTTNETAISLTTSGYSTTNTAYARPAGSSWYPHDSSKYVASSITCYLDCNLKTNNAAGTAYVEIYNETDATMVAEVSTTATEFNRVRSTSFNLTDGKKYTVKYKNTGGYTTYCSSALLIIQSSTVSKVRQFKRCAGLYTVSSTGYTEYYANVLYTSANYPNNVSARFASTMQGSSGNTIYGTTWDGTDVIAENSTSVTSVDTYLSDPFVPQNGIEYRTRSKISSLTGNLFNCYIVLEIRLGSSITKNSNARIKSTSSSTKNSDARVILENEMRARYDMETLIETTKLKDLSGNYNHGTPSGGVTIGGVTGKNANATAFDATDDVISLGNASSITSMSNLSIAAWIYMTAYPSTTYPIIGAENSKYQVGITSDGKVEIKLTLSGTTYTKTFGSTNSVGLDSWQHIVFTFDGTNWDVYINSTKQTTQTQSGTLDTTAVEIYLGKGAG